MRLLWASLAALLLAACGGGGGGGDGGGDAGTGTPSTGLSTGATTTLAGDGVPGGDDSSDGTGTTARFDFPRGLATDGTWMYVSESHGRRVRRVDPTTGATSTLAGDGLGTFRDSSDGTGATAGFVEPRGIVVIGAFLYVADFGAHRVRRVDLATGATDTPAGDGQEATRDSVDTTGGTASFHRPIALETDGRWLFVAERDTGRIRIVDPATGYTETLAGNGIGIDQESLDGTGRTAGFSRLMAMTYAAGALYAATQTRIARVDPETGAATFFAGDSLPGFADGPAATARFGLIRGLCSDGAYLYVSDAGNARVRRIDLVTGETITLAGNGTPLFADSSDGTGATAGFRDPRRCLFFVDRLFVADGESQRIRVVR